MQRQLTKKMVRSDGTRRSASVQLDLPSCFRLGAVVIRDDLRTVRLEGMNIVGTAQLERA